MIYHTYWRCCGHSDAGLAVGVALALAGVVGLARVAVVLPDFEGGAGMTKSSPLQSTSLYMETWETPVESFELRICDIIAKQSF